MPFDIYRSDTIDKDHAREDAAFPEAQATVNDKGQHFTLKSASRSNSGMRNTASSCVVVSVENQARM